MAGQREGAPHRAHAELAKAGKAHEEITRAADVKKALWLVMNPD
jgi:hypothetical protein